MGRPKSERHFSPHLTEVVFGEIQLKRFYLLKNFRDELVRIRKATIDDDQLFLSSLEIASEEFGIPVSLIAKRAGQSPLTINQWMHRRSMPQNKLSRPGVIDVVIGILDQHLGSAEERLEESKVNDKPALLSGVVKVGVSVPNE